MLAELVQQSFQGRVSRGRFAALVVVAFVLSFGGGFLGGFMPFGGFLGWFAGFVVAVITGAAGIWILASAAVKRFHDLGMSGWLAVLGIVPVIGVLMLIYLLLAPGHRYSNGYRFAP